MAESALVLTAGLVWFINGLHSRPRTTVPSQDIMTACLPTCSNPPLSFRLFVEPTEPPERDDMAMTPYAPFGVIFLRELATLPSCSCPRLLGAGDLQRGLSDATYMATFYKSFAVLRNTIHNTGFQRKEDLDPTRVGVVKRIAHARVGPVPHPEAFSAIPRLQGVVDFDTAPDLPPEEHIERLVDPRYPVNAIWSAFLTDLLQTAPNPKNSTGPSYVRLTMNERLRATEDTYKQTNLAINFTAVQWRASTPAQWQNNFDYLFPNKAHILPAAAQNYTRCNYYNEWKALIARLGQHDVTVIRQHLKKRVDTLYWLPTCKGDRIWDTSPRGKAFTRLPPGSGSAPRISIAHGKEEPQWIVIAPPAPQHAPEEEEEDVDAAGQ